MENELKQIFESFIKTSEKILKKDSEISPICFIIKKDYKTEAIIFRLTKETKQVYKNMLKKYLANSEMVAYIIIMDTWVTEINKETKDVKKKECLMRVLYTPKEIYRNYCIHNGNKIREEETKKFNKYFEDVNGLRDNVLKKDYKDEWDLWGEGINIEDIDKIKYFDKDVEEEKKK